jgi:hypothetical protein
VTVTLTAADNPDGTGVRELFYSINGTQFHSFGASVAIPIASEGINTIDFFAEDNAGNTEGLQSITVKLDKTAPVFTGVSRTPPNANGWNNTDVESSFTASDSLSVSPPVRRKSAALLSPRRVRTRLTPLLLLIWLETRHRRRGVT